MPHAFSYSEPAYAKVNLALQLIGRLPNGYHRLDSVAAFVDMGDELHAEPSQDGQLSLHIEGEFAEGLSATDNLVLRAALRLQEHAQTPYGARMRLVKRIPVGAGLGGGSADAGAALRLLSRLWRLDYNLPMLAELAEPLGADVPACVFSDPLRMEGIGEVLTAVPHVPHLAALLVYPHAPLWTPQVYGEVQAGDFSGALPPLPTMGASQEAWVAWMAHARNDLEPAARRLNLHIAPMLEALAATEGCLLARMSGSGSACFALYAEREQAQQAEARIRHAQPDWWVRAAGMTSARHLPIASHPQIV